MLVAVRDVRKAVSYTHLDVYKRQIQEIRKLAMPCGLSLEDIIEMFRILEEDE